MIRIRTERNRGARKIAIVWIVLALAMALSPVPARASVIEVPCAFSATVPLAQAIEQANATPGADFIVLEEDCTYGLFGVHNYAGGHNGLPEITEALTIIGNGARLERMGNVNVRFRLLKASAPLRIAELTFANGHADDPNDPLVKGGAIYTTADLGLTDVNFEGNRAPGSGGGVFVAGGNVRMVRGGFEDNVSELGSGGGLYVEGNLELDRVTFSGNQANRHGGAAAISGASGLVTESRFEGNQVQSLVNLPAGGALYSAGDLAVHHSEFVDNIASDGDGSGDGGAIHAAGQVTISDTLFEGNEASRGGAIYTDLAKTTVLRSRFYDNFAESEGSGIYLDAGGELTHSVANNLFAGNQTSHGSTLYVRTLAGETPAAPVAIMHNTMADPVGEGPGIYVYLAAAHVVNNIIANYERGVISDDASLHAGHNLYEIADLADAQVGTIVPYGDGTILLGDPQFVDRAGGNYRLQPGSPAIDSGYNVSYTGDIEGTERPLGDGFDIGAYEYAPPYTPPVAVDDNYVTLENTALEVAVPGILNNDQNAGGTNLTATPYLHPGRGQLVINADGSFIYTPDAGFTGADSFQYRAYDGQNYSNVATVWIKVQRANQSPTAGDDAYATLQDTALVVTAPGVLVNDEDPDGGGLTAILEGLPANGALTLNADGSFTYTPDIGFTGADSFQYRAYDGVNLSNVATARIQVLAEEEPPDTDSPHTIYLPLIVR